jgi:hypothetical protein
MGVHLKDSLYFFIRMEMVKLNIEGQHQVGRYATRECNAQPKRIDDNVAFVLFQAPKGHEQVIFKHGWVGLISTKTPGTHPMLPCVLPVLQIFTFEL